MLSPAVCTAPLRQALRRGDGVRGVFVRAAVPRGALLLTVPTTYCYWPDGLPPPPPPRRHVCADVRALCSCTPQRHRRRAYAAAPALSAVANNNNNNNSIYRSNNRGDGGGEADAMRRARQLRRCNRAVALFPEAWTWLCRLCADAPHDRVCLEASTSLDPLAAAAAYDGEDDDLVGGAAGAPRRRRPSTVVTVTVSPIEAALASCVALRYFYAHTLALSATARAQLHVGPSPHDVLAERCVRELPMQQYVEHGVEGLYAGGGDDAEAHTHTCLEQIAHNLRDALLTHASTGEYRLLDRHAAELDAVVLSALYVVRARVLRLPWLSPSPPTHRAATDGVDAHNGGSGGGGGKRRSSLDRRCRSRSNCGGGGGNAMATTQSVRVFAPGVYALNHSATPTAAAAVSPMQGVVVVRAQDALRAGDEVTLDYKACTRHLLGASDDDGDDGDAVLPHGSLADYGGDAMDAFADKAHRYDDDSGDDDVGDELDGKDWWESRYLLNDTQASA